MLTNFTIDNTIVPVMAVRSRKPQLSPPSDREATLSPKYQILIPRTLRRAMNLKPGQKFMLLQSGRSIRVVPVRPIHELRGVLKGGNIRPEDIRDKTDRPV